MLADIFGDLVLWPLDGVTPVDRAPSRLRRQIEPQEGMVALGNFKRCRAVAIILGQPLDFVIENIGQPLYEQKRKKLVLEPGDVLLAANRASCVPEHLFHGLRRGNCRGAPAASRDASCWSRHVRWRFTRR